MALAVAGLAAAGIFAIPTASQARTVKTASFPTVSYPVTFSVKNVDTTTAIKLNPGDGKTYQVQGHITAPAGALSAPGPAATLYVSGHGYGEWFWHFTSVPGYDYATAEAQAGLTSVTIDKLGYGASGIPDGNNVGYGTEASIDHQIIGDLKSGSYQLRGAKPAAFSKVALGAHAQAVFSAELESYTYNDASALVLTGFADEGFSPSLLTNYGINILNCELAPLHQGGPGTPSHYAYRERTPQMFIGDNLTNTDPAVQQAAAGLHSKDPCGYPVASVVPTVAENNMLGAFIKAPILSVFGSQDPEFIVPVATAFQTLEFALNQDATVVTLANTPQAITLGRTAAQYRDVNTAFLCKRGYGFRGCTP